MRYLPAWVTGVLSLDTEIQISTEDRYLITSTAKKDREPNAWCEAYGQQRSCVSPPSHCSNTDNSDMSLPPSSAVLTLALGQLRLSVTGTAGHGRVYSELV